MQIRQKLLNYSTQAQSIIAPIGIPDSGLTELKQNIQTTELIVPVIGGFSAGKSTLINSFLEQDLLPTAITPETALATELRYSDDSHIEAVTGSGSVERYEIHQLPELKDNARNFKNLRVYLNHPQLKAIEPLVLVDMPGFDAPIESHNQAILNYLNQGVYFIFLNSVEDGNLTASMKREIENLQAVNKGFAFCISKTNLRPQSDVDAVRNQITEQLQDYFDYFDEITLLDDNGGRNLQRILNAINPETLFASLFTEDLQNNYADLVESINLKIATLKGSKQEADEKVTALQQAIQTIQTKKENALEEANQRYSVDSVRIIKENIGQTIIQNKERLVEMAATQSGAFERELNELVKSNLLLTMQQRFRYIGDNIALEFGDITNSLDYSAKAQSLSGVIGKIAVSSQSVIDQTLGKLQKQITQNISGMMMKTLLGGVFGIAAATLMLLPEIIELITKNKREREKREQIEAQLLNTAIPQIKDKIGEVLPAILDEQIANLINQISTRFEQQLEQKQAEIQSAEAERQAKEAELDSIIADLDNSKAALENIANQYLFN